MNFILVLCLTLLCVIGIHAQFDLGDTCVFDKKKKISGICKVINNCEYAKQKFYVEENRTKTCGFLESTRIVCCPEGRLHETGVLSRYFTGYNDGLRQTNDIICRYNGYLPMTCCPNLPPRPQPPEPTDCERLRRPEKPNFSSVAHEIAWQKCLENQRFVEICIQNEQDLTIYSRVLACNISNTVPRISGGLDAERNEFPHMAVLGCHNSKKQKEERDPDIIWVGGGSLISDQYIVTAGHVLVDNTHGKLRYALLGVLDKTDLRNGQLYNVIGHIPHKSYTSADKHDDIALVKLDRPVRFSEFIRPICLPVPGLKYHETSRIITGWGDTAAHVGTSQFLQKAYIQEVGEEACTQTLDVKGFKWVNETMICASGPKRIDGRFSDSCQGDSGGPLMSLVEIKELKCQYVLNGVVSWGPNCGSGDPGAYTRVTAYVDWIVGHVWSDEVKKRTPEPFGPPQW